MDHILNASLAGGVAIGTTANMVLYPFGALIIGCGAGLLSVLGFDYIGVRLLHLPYHLSLVFSTMSWWTFF